MSNYKTLKLMTYDIYIDDLDRLEFNRKVVINTLNPHSYVTAKKDKIFQDALHDSDVLIPDGSGIVLAAKLIEKKEIVKIAGADLQKHLLVKLNARKGKCFYMGSSESTLEKIKEHMSEEYPGINIQTYSPPYKEVLSEEDNKIIVSQINKFEPDVLFVGMTAPKQEKWVYQHKEVLNANIICSIGAVFDFYAGTVKRSSPFWVEKNLEWLPRLIHEPKRLWKRNFISTPLFLLDVMLYKFK
ncbi:MAG: WecB/TagA/CpsF family glycosyltransferase [Sulfurimonadaceae bacterium]